MTCWSNF